MSDTRRRGLRAVAGRLEEAMVDPAIVGEVRLLLAEGIKHREIVRRLPISRATVGAIASGKRPDYPQREFEEVSIERTGPHRRCPGCGGMVLMPCLACELRRNPPKGDFHLSEKSQPQSELKLDGEERNRYERIRWRQRVNGNRANLKSSPPVEDDCPVTEQQVLNPFEQTER